MVRREVIETVTPGVAFADDLLDGSRNNFICALNAGSGKREREAGTPIGVAAADVSTGEVRLIVATMDELDPLLARLTPRELLLGPNRFPLPPSRFPR